MDQLLLLALVALGLPLLSFVLVIFNQRALDQRAHLISIPAVAFSFGLSLYIAWLKLQTGAAALGPYEWSIDWIRFGIIPGFGPLTIPASVLIDNITAIMMVVVTGISVLVHVFSIGYMRSDERYARYYAFLGIFTFAMLGLVLSSNLFMLYGAWELVGFSSWALIAHWYERPAPQYAANKAFITNRIGDAVLFTGILLLDGEFHTFNLREIFGLVGQGLPITFSLLGFSPETTLTIAGLLLFGGAIAKSAQFPLHVWLPDAMEGPTPISALIHAATMVAAGVYLMARIFPILTADAMLVVACTGAFTSVLAATIALTQTDIKRVLAYSTVSQLGLMMMAIGAGAVSAGIFHLVTHAAFKACLFLGAGSVIHAVHRAQHETNDHEWDAQDIRTLGGLRKKMPLTAYSFVVATLAVTGLPFLAGMMSKDEILSGTLAYGELQGGIAMALPVIGFIVTILTAAYMWRLTFLTFFGPPARRTLYDRIRESPLVMTAPLLLLAAASLWIWYSINPFNPETGRFLTKWVKTTVQVIPPQTAPPFRTGLNVTPHSEPFGFAIAPSATSVLESPMPHQLALSEKSRSLTPLSMWLALGSAVTGLLLALWLYLLRSKRTPSKPRSRTLGILHEIVFRGYYIDSVYNFAVVGTVLLSSRIVAWADEAVIDGVVNATARMTVILSRILGYFDRFVVDGIVTFAGAAMQFLGLMIRSLQSGRIQTYLAWVVASVIAIFIVIRYVVLALP
ncbi:MAG: NADH-quinone oxidoreductase subunit L [Bacteroidota bacterium]|nr:NADH-quinone oxidoreductase subunit L [Bacteroidota bacterium]MDP4232945.1 NADH-quinone oxidoreductase subunit L [Bacteroidota bacterium]MDP4241989.1 NADH-quinone oxidoreductase subunit L [Bacteroidota bacterium]MDP4286892.1 NADH-quinone oxidoreductase subunit L [Bacteroidota bacterium]